MMQGGELRSTISAFLTPDGVILQGKEALMALRDGREGEVFLMNTFEEVEEFVETVLARCPGIELELVRALPWDDVHRVREAIQGFARLTHTVNHLQCELCVN
jgi:hypothetical protein